MHAKGLTGNADADANSNANAETGVTTEAPLFINRRAKKGYNSVKIQFRVMVLGICGTLMTLNKCMKFQSNSTHSVRKELARKGLTNLHAKV